MNDNIKNLDVDNLIKSIDEKIERLDEIDKDIQVKEKYAYKMIDEAIEKLSSIDPTKKIQEQNIPGNYFLNISTWYKFLKKENLNYKDAEDKIIKLSEEQPQLTQWCLNLINGSIENKKISDFKEDSFDINNLIKSIDEKIEKLEKLAEDKNKHNNDYDNLSKEEIIGKLKNELVKSTTIFETGGIRPTNELGESWIGKVCFQKSDETQPKDLDGNNLTPLITLFLDKLPYVPKELENIKLITIFMNDDIWNNLNSWDLDKWFVFRTYDNLDNLVPCDYVSSKIKPFPLVPHFKNDDYPMYNDCYDEMIDFINDLEDNKGIDYYNDIAVNTYPYHKIGGHPASIQGGVGFDNDCKFVLQICSDEKANLNIVDSGNFYFGYNPDTKVWCVRCDFY